MKVFIAGTSFDSAYGGPAYSVSRLASALADAGVTVGLWAPDGSSIRAPIAPERANLVRLSGSETQAVDSFGRPGIIHDNGLWLRHNHMLARVAHRGGIPRVVSTRGMLEPWARRHKRLRKSVAWPLYQKRDLMRAALLHATTEVEALTLKALELGVGIAVVPNGVDLPDAAQIDALRARTSAPGLRTAVFLGRIYPIKGLPMLVEAWRRVRPAGWRLVIAGPDEAGHRRQIERAVRESALDDVISFVGPVTGDDKMKLLATADLFVLPTHSESFGMAIAEALAHALPVLTTTAAPWPQLEQSKSGWRVSATVDGLTHGVSESTRQGSATLRRMGEKGREFVAASFDWNRVAGDLIRAYESLGG